jgi:hypothetical protein
MSTNIHRIWFYVYLTSKEIIRRLELKRSPGTKARDFILMALIEAGKNGLPQKALIEKTGLSRAKVYDDCEKLEKEEGLIRSETKGKRTTYYATQKIFDDLSLHSLVFGKEIFSKISDSHIPVITQRNLCSNRFHGNSPYYETRFNDDVYFEKKFNRDDDSIERLLFEYSSRVGSIITYILLQAMNSDVIKTLTFNEKMSGSAAKDYLVKKWIQNVISPTEMLKVLRKCLRDARYEVAGNESQELGNISSYGLKDEAIGELTGAFSRVFPNVYNDLEETRLAFPKSLEQEKKLIEQSICKHELALELKDNEKHFECSKCSFKLVIAIARLIKDKEIIAKLDQQIPPKNSCVKFGHQWTKRSDYYVAFTSFHCVLCGGLARFRIEEDKKLKKIDEVVSLKLEGVNVSLCNDIEYFFHLNNNQRLTIKDFMKFFEEFRIGIRIDDPKKFIETVSSILDILVRYEYIKEITILDGHEPLKREFIRKEHLNI